VARLRTCRLRSGRLREPPPVQVDDEGERPRLIGRRQGDVDVERHAVPALDARPNATFAVLDLALDHTREATAEYRGHGRGLRTVGCREHQEDEGRGSPKRRHWRSLREGRRRTQTLSPRLTFSRSSTGSRLMPAANRPSTAVAATFLVLLAAAPASAARAGCSVARSACATAARYAARACERDAR